ncbi:MAG: flippase-like domain-containing protein [Acidimicrobiia bacterium]|nr:flippase-like domain-containing protein [Acidimicrobiia bacterium]
MRLRRGGLSDLAVVAALGLAAGALLVWFGGPREVADSLERASPGWLAAGLAFSVAAPVCAAIAQLAVVERRPALPDAVVAQLAGSFADRVTPGAAGGGAIRVRFLQRGGLDASAATAAVTLAGAAVSVVHGSALLLVGAYVAGEGVGDVDLPDRWAVMVGVVVALAAVGLLLRAAPGRRPLAGPAGRGETDLASVLRRPVRGLVLLGGASGVIASTTLAFLASAGAFDAGVSPAEAALVSLAAAAVSTAAVTPGGLVATEGALVAGLTAVGSLPGPAVVTVLAFRVLTYWLPILVGGLSLRSSRRRALL